MSSKLIIPILIVFAILTIWTPSCALSNGTGPKEPENVQSTSGGNTPQENQQSGTNAQGEGQVQGEPTQDAGLNGSIPEPVEMGSPEKFVTLDQNTLYDEVLAETGTEPDAIFHYVRDNIRNECYAMSVRGGLGTLCASGGNSIDKSELLGDLLTKAGHRVRYAHGRLDDGKAGEIIESMFSEFTANEIDWSEVLDSISETQNFDEATKNEAQNLISVVSDPQQDQELLNNIRDHWWIEIETPDGWVALDPCFSEAESGDVYAQPQGNFETIPLEDIRLTEIAILAVYEDGSRVGIAGFSAPIKDISRDVINVRIQPNGDAPSDQFNLIVNNQVIADRPVRFRTDTGSQIDSIIMNATGYTTTQTGKTQEGILWQSFNGSVPNEGCAATVVIETGGIGPLVAGALKKKYDEMDPVHAAMPQEGLIGGLLQGAQSSREQSKPLSERVALRSVSDGILAVTYGVYCLGNFKDAASTTGSTSFLDGAKFTVVSREEIGEEQQLSINSFGASPKYITMQGQPKLIEVGLAMVEPFIEDSVLTGVLDQLTGTKVATYTNLLSVANEQNLEMKAFCEINIGELSSTSLSEYTISQIRDEIVEGAVVVAVTTPIEFNGAEYEILSISHSPPEQRIIRPEGDQEQAVLAILTTTRDTLEQAIYAGVTLYSFTEAVDAFANIDANYELESYYWAAKLVLSIKSMIEGFPAGVYHTPGSPYHIPGSPDTLNFWTENICEEVALDIISFILFGKVL